GLPVENQALPQVPSEQLPVHFPYPIQVADCYQCGKCTAGCPVAMHMDVAPNQVVRLVQLGEWEKALQSRAIWECVGCQTCSTRCPKEVDCAGVMDALREAWLRLTGTSWSRSRKFSLRISAGMAGST